MRFSRRQFINLSARSGSAFILGLHAVSCDSLEEDTSFPEIIGDFERPFLKILADSKVVIIAPVPEIGQGVRTSLPLLVAEELNTALSEFVVEQGAASDKLGGMAAAGSDSISDYFSLLRQAGAITREMLKIAAATHWKVTPDQIDVQDGLVRFGRKETPWYKLIPYLKDTDVPKNAPLKSKEDFQFIGQSLRKPDTASIVCGKAQYGLDVRLPGMQYAVIARCPVYGGKLKSYEAKNTLRIKGVVDVMEVPAFIPGENGYAEVLDGVAVIATSTWAAIKGRESLLLEWDFGSNKDKTSEELMNQSYTPEQVLREEKGEIMNADGIQSMEAVYFLPPMAHLCMEPMNFTAHIIEDKAMLTGPTQNPRFIQDYISGIFKIEKRNVEVIPTLAGGGFGRRLAIDYALEAAVISKKMRGPIQVVWTREDDVKHDYFRTAARHYVKASFSGQKLMGWEHEIYTQPIGNGPIYEVQGAADLPLNIPNIKISWGRLDSALRIGSWRSVAQSHNSFVVNCWLDEIATSMGLDPINLIMDLIGVDNNETTVTLPLRGRRGSVVTHRGRLKQVIRKVAANSNWERKLAPGWGRGFSFAVFKNSYSAVVVEVQLSNKAVTIEHVYSVLDCGQVVHPDGVKAQMTGSIMDGISTVFFNEVTYDGGKVDQQNFHQLQWPRMQHVPELHLEVVNSGEAPRGAGEPPYPAVPPAIANAIFNASGIRLRRLPATHQGFKMK